MDLDLQWLLIGLPVVFALGWLASRMDLRQLRRESRDAPRAYYKGLNLLLNEQQDKAIDAFIEAVQHDPDTTELHFALGNLFRRRGEFERAVRVHQHLLARADLASRERDRAQHALAQDYLRAGLFDRAEAAFRALDGSAYEAEARQALLTLYERSRDWPRAIEVAGQIAASGGPSPAPRVAHHWCELAQAAIDRGDDPAADEALRQARLGAPTAARPLVMLGRRLSRAGRHVEALSTWDELRRCRSDAFSLVVAEYAEAALACGRQAAAHEALLELAAQAPGIDVLRALARLDPGDRAAHRERLLALLRTQPTLSAAIELLSCGADPTDAATQSTLSHALASAARPLQRYRCASCGFEAQHWFWQCPGCLSWDSYPPRRVEEQ